MHHREGCWWYACIKVQCLHEIALPLLTLTDLVIINNKTGKPLIFAHSLSREGQHPSNQGQRLLSHLSKASRGFQTCICSCISVATELGISEESRQIFQVADWVGFYCGADTQAFQRKGLSAGISTANNALSPLTWLGTSQIEPISPHCFFTRWKPTISGLSCHAGDSLQACQIENASLFKTCSLANQASAFEAMPAS